ncbi:MAG TPA: GIY-YIG nuclease family protein [Allosphingosinicella sp.]|nr:GIY-YIG nuclease family protein [Allosphingosinicella sp.]
MVEGHAGGYGAARLAGQSGTTSHAPRRRPGSRAAYDEGRLRLHLANRRNGTLYIGVRSDLPKRIYEHRIGSVPGFTRRYGCKMLVWYEAFDDLDAARQRELQMKERQRAWKLRVIEEVNPDWVDLYDTLF